MLPIRTALLLLLIPLWFSCSNNKKAAAEAATNFDPKIHKAKYIDSHQTICDSAALSSSKEDGLSVLINKVDGRQFTLSTGQLKRLLRSFPELNDSNSLLSPDETYAKRGLEGDHRPCDGDTYGCEQCQDTYYALYIYFLKERCGRTAFGGKRDTLLRLYRDINSIEGQLDGGGTYFGHQYYRIFAYVEYSVYLFSVDSYDDFKRPYSILPQKKLYIQAIRQTITDELSVNFDIREKDKFALKKDLFKTVDEIDRLINSYYYLSMVKDFHYTHY